MVPFQLFWAAVLVSGVWCFSEVFDDEVEIGQPMHHMGKDKYTKSFKCPAPFGTYADPNDCSKFFVCFFKGSFPKQCRGSNLFDEKSKLCLDKQKVKCGNEPNRDQLKITEIPTQPPKTLTISRGTAIEKPAAKKDEDEMDKTDTRCPQKWGILPHHEDCSKFIICFFGAPTEYTCRKNNLFHEKYRGCYPKDKVTCGDDRFDPYDPRPRPSKTTTITTEAETAPVPTTKAETTTLKTTPIPTTTVETTITTETTPIPTTTEKTTITTEDPTTMQVTTTPETTITTVAETTTVTPESTTVELTTLPSIPTTPPTTPKVSKDNIPPPTECEEDDVQCIIDGTGNVKEWFVCPERYGFFAHASSHQLFIQCDNWNPYLKECAENTVFSPKHQVCIWLNYSPFNKYF